MWAYVSQKQNLIMKNNKKNKNKLVRHQNLTVVDQIERVFTC